MAKQAAKVWPYPVFATLFKRVAGLAFGKYAFTSRDICSILGLSGQSGRKSGKGARRRALKVIQQAVQIEGCLQA